MNKIVEHKIDALLEEVNKAVQQSVSKYRPISDTLTMAPSIGGIGSIAQGYTVGKEMGHPYAGALIGAEAAAGAKSIHDNSVGIGDVYTRPNMRKRAVQGAAIGAGLAGINIARMDTIQTPSVRRALLDIQSKGGYDGYNAGEALQAAYDPIQYAGEEMLATGMGAALLAPGLKYGLGKVFGSEKPTTPRIIK